MVKDNSYLRAIVNADGAVILDTSRGTISTLNQPGAYVWQALWRGEGLKAIASSVAGETGQPLDIVEHDIRDFIEALRKHDLLAH